ncbi:MAG: type II secretion system protein [Verrucomicrobiota bacterium]
MKRIQGFTLLELLMVISMIAVLAGLTVPAISGALDRTNQTKDLSNAKQLAQVLLMDANDHNGIFRKNEAHTNTVIAGTATPVFRGLLKDKVLSTTEVFSGYGTQPFEDGTNYDASFTANNVSWAYFAGLMTGDDDRLPLLISKGNTNITTPRLTGQPTEVELDGSGVWGKRGIIIAYKGQNVEFKKAKDGKIKLGADVSPVDESAALLQP